MTDEPAPAETGAALAVRPVSNEVIRPLDRVQVVAAMNEHQQLLREILDESDWQGNPDQPDSFVKKSGWRKIALAYNLSLKEVASEVERDPEGQPLRAKATWRAVAPNGRAMEGDGYCAIEERRFGRESGRAKLENDMRATATTRAKNRAISDLIGMGKVSAEEVGHDATPVATTGLPDWAQPTPDIQTFAGTLREFLVLAGHIDPDPEVTKIGQALFDLCDGGIPNAIATALVLIQQSLTLPAATPAPETTPTEAEVVEPDAEPAAAAA